MGERKVINKYYPHDFDPRTIPRRRRPKHGQTAVRMMLPMSVRCAACGEYLGRGTKFNARKEDAAGEVYLGAIQVFRFYIKCSRCSAEIAFKTDPKNSDYAVESGATRNFEPWRAAAGEEAQREDDEAAAGDSMAALENRSRGAKREMDVAAALEEMQSLKSRQAEVTPEQLLESLNRTRSADAHGRATPQQLDEEDEALIKSISFRSSTNHVKRVGEEDDDDEDFWEASQARTVGDHRAHKKQRQAADHDRPFVVLTKRLVPVSKEAEGKEKKDHAEKCDAKASSVGEAKASKDALQGLCCCYPGSDEDDDESC
ncbi:hypothetical protein ACP70R_041057 [Stipagrostis hirtigluma subsp. patula]